MLHLEMKREKERFFQKRKIDITKVVNLFWKVTAISDSKMRTSQ